MKRVGFVCRFSLFYIFNLHMCIEEEWRAKICLNTYLHVLCLMICTYPTHRLLLPKSNIRRQESLSCQIATSACFIRCQHGLWLPDKLNCLSQQSFSHFLDELLIIQRCSAFTPHHGFYRLFFAGLHIWLQVFCSIILPWGLRLFLCGEDYMQFPLIHASVTPETIKCKHVIFLQSIIPLNGDSPLVFITANCIERKAALL